MEVFIGIAMVVGLVILIYLVQQRNPFKHKGVHKALGEYREATQRKIDIENERLPICRQLFAEGYGTNGSIVCAYLEVLSRATVENQSSRRNSELPSPRDTIKDAIVGIAETAVAKEEDASILGLKAAYVSLARFLSDSKALVVMERNRAWLSEDPHHPGLRRRRDADLIDADVEADEDRLAEEFDAMIALKRKTQLRVDALDQEEKLADARLDSAVSKLIKEFSELNGIGDAREIASSFGKTLAVVGGMNSPVYPISRLPYPKVDIMRALEVMFIVSSKDKDTVNLLEEAYSNLANFIPDEEAATVNATWGKPNENQRGLSAMLFRVAEEKTRLLGEFDSYCEEMQTDAMNGGDQGAT